MKLSEVKKLLIRAASRHVSVEEAEYFAEEVIETEIRKSSHGKRFTDVTKDIKSWSTDSAVKKSISLPGYIQYDFEERAPSLKIKQIHDELESMVKANGVAMISIINSGGMHVMHLWTQGLAKRGIFALSSWNGGPDAVVPFNGTRGILGTNPVSYGFPSDKGESIIDMATSEIPYFKIVDAKRTGKILPTMSAVDSGGEVTTNPKEGLDEEGVSNLLPMGGGYKGYAINYLMEVMTSALIGAKASSEMSSDYIEKEHGGFIIAIAIDKVTEIDKYEASIKSLNQKIRSQAPKKGVEKVIVPGDGNLSAKETITDDLEIDLDGETINELYFLSGNTM